MNGDEIKYRIEKLEDALNRAANHTERMYLENNTGSYTRLDLDHGASMAHSAILAAQLNMEDVKRTLRNHIKYD